MATKTFTCTKDASAIGNVDGTAITFDYSGKDDHHPVGVLNTAVYKGRSILYFPVSFTGMNKITSAVITLKTTAAHNTFGSNTSKTLKAARYLRTPWTEFTPNTVETWGNSAETYEAWSGVNSAGVDYATYVGGTDPYGVTISLANGLDENESSATVTTTSGAGATVTINITGMVRWWQTNGNNYGVLLYNNNETSEAHYMEFMSRENTTAPSLTVTYETNTTPTAAVVTSPTANALSTTSARFEADMTDADAADYVTKADIQVSATSNFTSPVYSTTQTYTDTTSKSISTAISATTMGITALTTYYWRVRMYDSAGAVSPWSAGTDTFRVNNKPSTPSGLSPTGGAVITTLTPTFSGTSTDADTGDYTKYVNVTVYNATSNAVVWTSGNVLLTANGAFAVTSGVTLSTGTSYYWRAFTTDTYGAVSSTTSNATFSTYATGASISTPSDDTGTGWVKTLTPVMTFVAPSSITSYTIKLYDTSRTLIRTIGPTSATGTTISYTYAGTPALTWNTRYFWTATYVANGVTAPESAQAMFHTNSAPAANLVAPADGQAIASLDPSFEVTFSDADVGYGLPDSPTKLTVEVSRASDSVIMYTLDKTTGLVNGTNAVSKATANTVTAGAGGLTLTKEVTYRYRAQYTDNSGSISTNNLGAYSSYRTFKPTDGATVTNVVFSAADLTGTTVKKPSPTVQYTYTGYASKAQIASRVVIKNSSTSLVIYDSGFVVNQATSGSTASWVVPAGYLQNSTSVKIEVTARDTDNVDSTTVASALTYTTDWTTPEDVEGVSATFESGSYVVRWSASQNAFFAYYTIYRQEFNTGLDWEYLGEVRIKSQVFFVDYSSAINKTYKYRVTQTVDYGNLTLVESDYDTATETTVDPASDNWFIVYPGRQDLSIELYAQSEDRQAPFQEEVFEPFGRGRKVVVRSSRYGMEGSFEAFIPSDEVKEKLAKLEEIQSNYTGFVYLKDPFGNVIKAALGAPSISYQPVGHVVANISYIEVS